MPKRKTTPPRAKCADFGELLSAARSRGGVSYAQAGQLAGVSPSFLNDTEKGRRVPDPAIVTSLARALGIPAAEAHRTAARSRGFHMLPAGTRAADALLGEIAAALADRRLTSAVADEMLRVLRRADTRTVAA